jgi:transcriptional regulator with XRE-family HTH domain
MGKGIPNLGSIIRKLRLSRGLEQVEFADRTGISQSHLSKIENGEANPSLRTLKKMAGVLGVEEKVFFPEGTSPISLEDDSITFGHVDIILRQFIAKEDSMPFIELAMDLYENGFTQEELEALRLIFMSRKRK